MITSNTLFTNLFFQREKKNTRQLKISGRITYFTSLKPNFSFWRVIVKRFLIQPKNWIALAFYQAIKELSSELGCNRAVAHAPALLNVAGGGVQFCRAEQLQNWTLTIEINLVGSQEEQISGAGFLHSYRPTITQCFTPRSALLARFLRVREPALQSLQPASSVFQHPARIQEWWSQHAERRQACMNTKTKPAWSSFRPDRSESVLSLRTWGLSDFYSD